MRALRLALLFGGFGLLPLWTSAIVVYAESLHSRSSEYWNVAPWLIVIAIPLCAITLAIAGVTYAVYLATKGSNSRKLTRAAGAFAILLVAVLVGAGLFYNRYKAQQAELAAEKKAAKEFVEGSARVRAAAPNGFTVSLQSSAMDENIPVAYTYGVRSRREPPEYVRVVVDVSREAGRTEFHLRCVVPESFYRSEPVVSDPCESKRRRR